MNIWRKWWLIEHGLWPPPRPRPKPGPLKPTIWWPGAAWWRPILYSAWGLARGQYTPAQLAQVAKSAGYRAVAIQGYPASRGGTFPDGASSDNRPFAADLRQACHELELGYLMWNRADQIPYERIAEDVGAFGPIDGYLADVETFPMLDSSFPMQLARDFPTLPRAVIIAGMPEPKFCAGFVQYRFDCCTQAYIGTNGPGIVGGADRDAYWRGWPAIIVNDPTKPTEQGCLHTFPCAEVGFEGAPAMRDQQHLFAGYPGPSAYTAEAGPDLIALA